jgi:SAM-dependent methyltransferase
MSDFDPDRYRQDSIEQWEAAAAGWSRRAQQMRAFAEPVTERLLDALHLQRGQRVLDLAAGLGEVGLLVAQRVGPDGSVVIVDQAEAMIEAARERVAQAGAGNVELKRMDAEWIDLELSSVDAVACRFGVMLMADPDAALQECRRVLRSEGRLALAVWDSPARNPWASAPAMVLAERGLMQVPPPQPGIFRPGMFALADADALAERIQDAGFTEVAVESGGGPRHPPPHPAGFPAGGGVAAPHPPPHDGFEEFWETSLDMSPGFHDAVMSCPPGEIEQIREAVAASLAPFTAPDGSMEIPAASLLAHACA